jgi:hypothetical protein
LIPEASSTACGQVQITAARSATPAHSKTEICEPYTASLYKRGGPKPGVRILARTQGAADFGQSLGHIRQPPGQQKLARLFALRGFYASQPGHTSCSATLRNYLLIRKRKLRHRKSKDTRTAHIGIIRPCTIPCPATAKGIPRPGPIRAASRAVPVKAAGIPRLRQQVAFTGASTVRRSASWNSNPLPCGFGRFKLRAVIQQVNQ